MKYLFTIFFLFIVGTFTVSAEIAPVEYQRMQASAPEQLEVAVLRSNTRRFLFSRDTDVTLNVEVISVTGSATGLNSGDRITITYTHTRNPRGWAGPRAIPIQKRGTVTSAFLEYSPQSKTYVPAARGASFDPPIMFE
jgi:hypothetical protein